MHTTFPTRIIPRYTSDDIEIDYGHFVIKVSRAFEVPFLELIKDINSLHDELSRRIISVLDRVDDDSVSSMQNALDDIRDILNGRN